MPDDSQIISAETRQQLVAERDRLRAERADIERAIQRQNAVAQALERIEGLLALGDGVGPRKVVTAPGMMGPRDAIRLVLREKPEGMTAVEIKDEVERRGLCREIASAIPVRQRIGGEIHRMRGSGKLVRRYKRYQLPEKEAGPALEG